MNGQQANYDYNFGKQAMGGGPGGGMTQQHKGKQPGMAKHHQIGTDEIKEIVMALNSPSFNENLTLVSFDEKSPVRLELLELLNKILSFLDSKNEVDVRSEMQEDTSNRITEFLKILGYPSSFEDNFKNAIIMGERRTLYLILHWLLTRIPEMQRRSYLAKFLVSLSVPEEFVMDDEMRDIFQVYKELQAEFQGMHQHLEQLRNESMVPTDLKKDITQLEQERDQLISKISLFKTKNSNKEEFQQLLEATSMLRKEQEVEAKHMDKLYEQKAQLEMCEQQLLATKQKLIDIKKASNADVSAERMLEGLKLETKKNRELCYDIIGRELQDKTDRLQKIEQLLSEPLTTQSELEKLTNEVKKLQREVINLEDKLKKATPSDDKLAVYKAQAAGVSKKKEKTLEALKQLEMEKIALEKTLSEKESKFSSGGGSKMMKGDEFKQYVASLRGKTNTYKKMKNQLGEIRSELTVLTRTEHILKSRAENIEEFMKRLESKKGIFGYTDTQNKLEDVSAHTANLNEAKDKTLQEISKLVQEIDQQLKSKKVKLAPQIKSLRTLRDKLTEIEKAHEEKKKAFENVTMSLENDKNRLKSDCDSLFTEYKADETKYHTHNLKMQIMDSLQKRIVSEASYVTHTDKRLSAENKSYTEMYNTKMNQQNELIRDLKKHQKHVKQNLENNGKQVKLFGDLKYILEIKRNAGSGGDGGIVFNNGEGEFKDKSNAAYDRLVIDRNS